MIVTHKDFPEDYPEADPQRISIDGDISSGRPVLMTYHDIGINHNACFASFLNMLRAYDDKFRYFTVVHIDAPQHHYEDTAPGKFHDDEAMEAFDLLELASQVEEIRAALQVERFVALGVGAATNVWTYYAINYSVRLRGMVLLNALGSGASWREWIFEQLLRGMGAQSQWLADSLASSLLTRYFPRAAAGDVRLLRRAVRADAHAVGAQVRARLRAAPGVQRGAAEQDQDQDARHLRRGLEGQGRDDRLPVHYVCAHERHRLPAD